MEIKLLNIPVILDESEIHFQKGDTELHKMIEGLSYFYQNLKAQDFFALSCRELESFTRSENHKEALSATGEVFDQFIKAKELIFKYKVKRSLGEFHKFDKKLRLKDQISLLNEFSQKLINNGPFSWSIEQITILGFTLDSIAVDLKLRVNLLPYQLDCLESLFGEYFQRPYLKLAVGETIL